MTGGAFTLDTTGPEETERLGRLLAAILPKGTVLCLRGDLAAGKTCLVRGLAQAMAGEASVHSPTFTLVNEYRGARKLYHLDLYRLGGPEDVADLGYEELFEPDGVCAVEWAERAGGLLPARRVEVALAHAGGDRRHIVIEDHGVLPQDWAAALSAAWQRDDRKAH
jgi:tRNA threonylcarbamoyladenosine biosynthesis protein TsaE